MSNVIAARFTTVYVVKWTDAKGTPRHKVYKRMDPAVVFTIKLSDAGLKANVYKSRYAWSKR